MRTLCGTILAAGVAATALGDSLVNIGDVRLKGRLGERLDAMIDRHVASRDVDYITAPFMEKTETKGWWQTEFWGKWMHSSVAYLRYATDEKCKVESVKCKVAEELCSKIERGIERILASQEPCGYIGNYPDALRCGEGWDVPQMLNDGFHHVTIDTFRHRMDEEGLKVSAAFQKFLVDELGFAPKAYLIGMSWGGFFSVRYTVNYPENVAKIYLDAPLLSFVDFRYIKDIGPWNGKKPEEGWGTSPEMPLNMAERLAATKIPVLLLYGGVDAVVPPARNCEPFAERFKAAGGDIKVIKRAAYAHHPHGVEVNENTIKDFFFLTTKEEKRCN